MLIGTASSQALLKCMPLGGWRLGGWRFGGWEVAGLEVWRLGGLEVGGWRFGGWRLEVRGLEAWRFGGFKVGEGLEVRPKRGPSLLQKHLTYRSSPAEHFSPGRHRGAACSRQQLFTRRDLPPLGKKAGLYEKQTFASWSPPAWRESLRFVVTVCLESQPVASQSLPA